MQDKQCKAKGKPINSKWKYSFASFPYSAVGQILLPFRVEKYHT